MVIKSKKVLYGDLHLRMNDPLGVPTEDGLTTRIHQKIVSLNKVIDLAIEVKADEIIDLGDLFSYLNPPDKLRNVYAGTIIKALNNDIAVTRVLGNHETDGFEGIGSDAGLLSSNNYNVVASVDWFAAGKSECKVFYIPEVKKEYIVKGLDAYKDGLVVGHFGVNGASMGATLVSNEIPIELLRNRFYPTFLGHIHKRQILDDGKIVYVGALCRNDFGDKDIPTGCCVVDIEYDVDNGVIVSVGHDFVEIPDIGLHVIEIVEDEKKDESVITKLEDLIVDRCADEIKLSEGDIVKIVYKGTYEWFSSKDVTKFQGLLKKLGAAKVMIQFDPISSTVDKDVFDEREDNLFDVVKKVAEKDGKNPEVGLRYLNRVFDDGKLES